MNSWTTRNFQPWTSLFTSKNIVLSSSQFIHKFLTQYPYLKSYSVTRNCQGHCMRACGQSTSDNTLLSLQLESACWRWVKAVRKLCAYLMTMFKHVSVTLQTWCTRAVPNLLSFLITALQPWVRAVRKLCAYRWQCLNMSLLPYKHDVRVQYRTFWASW